MYSVKSETDTIEKYIVDLILPKCTCFNFKRYRFPCKHMCAVLLYVDGFSFEFLPEFYHVNPYICIELFHQPLHHQSH